MLPTAAPLNESITKEPIPLNNSFFWEVATPDKVLIRPEVMNLSDGTEIPQEVWKPLLGGEMEQVWDELLPGIGDEIYVSGSMIARLVFGGYAYDRNTGLAPASLRSDIDVWVADTHMSERVKVLAGKHLNSRRTAVSSKLHIGGLDVGFVDEEKVRQTNIEGVETVIEWARVHSQEEFVQRGERLLSELKKADTESLFALNYFMPYEGLSVRLHRDSDGLLRANLVDPTDLLRTYLMEAQLIKQSINGVHYGFAFANPNMHSARTFLIEALSHMSGVEFSNNAPLWAIEVVPRMIKAAAELDLEIYNEGYRELDPENIEPEFYPVLWNLTRRLLQENVFSLANGLEPNAIFRRQMQESFARSAATNLVSTLNYMFFSLPAGEVVSDELAEFFEPVYDLLPHCNITAFIVTYCRGPNGEAYYPDIPAFRARAKFEALETVFYSSKLKEMGGLAVSTIAPDATDLYFPDYNARPASMSEYMAMVFASVGWDPERDIDKINKVIANWTPKGTLKGTWKTEEFEFDKGLDLGAIQANMRRFKAYLDKIEG